MTWGTTSAVTVGILALERVAAMVETAETAMAAGMASVGATAGTGMVVVVVVGVEGVAIDTVSVWPSPDESRCGCPVGSRD